MKNIFLDRLKPIYFKEEITIINLSKLRDKTFWERIYPYNTNILNNLIFYKENIKIYEIKKFKCRKLILKLLITINNKIEEYFIIKGIQKVNIPDIFYIQFLLTNELICNKNELNDIFLKKYNRKDINKMYYDYKCNIDNNKEFFKKQENNLKKNHKNHIMSVIYEYRYIKGSNGEKEIVPIETIINKNLSCNDIYKLFNYFNIELNYINFCKDYLLFKTNKKTRNEKILCYILKEHKNSYFKFLNNDLKRIICSFL